MPLRTNVSNISISLHITSPRSDWDTETSLDDNSIWSAEDIDTSLHNVPGWFNTWAQANNRNLFSFFIKSIRKKKEITPF